MKTKAHLDQRGAKTQQCEVHECRHISMAERLKDSAAKERIARPSASLAVCGKAGSTPPGHGVDCANRLKLQWEAELRRRVRLARLLDKNEIMCGS